MANYYDVDRQKVGEKIVISDEQIAYLFQVVQEYVRWACRSSNVKYFFFLSLTSTSANFIANNNYYHCGRPYCKLVSFTGFLNPVSAARTHAPSPRITKPHANVHAPSAAP
jgi:hypothetical protein